MPEPFQQQPFQQQPFQQQIVPLPQAKAADILVAYQISFEFYEEIRYREAFNDYCQRHQRLARQHQQELAAMQDDVNLYGWFLGRRGKA
ncbi:MAG: hypothetical protein KME07_08720 [Pegethrix bostrychoides GSE-TBD4-15B]|jgi:hypothetical protein|uniref:Uncharacterized protein n=1 Tax=Pegethrix bostrychoides GSE-TBD4-15B TaxID=2839662 RepID=A0A951U497_9CYAN|nr:hypothetical protein [Pegethrix bostrychoides GSE-TBD4-15B]